MKRFFVIFAVLTAMVFMVGCGGDSNENNENNGNESGNNEDNSQGCTSGEFKCVGNESYYCNSLGSWVYDARCENGCSSLTGKCITNSGGDNNDTDSGDFSDSANDNTDSDTNTNTETDPCTEEGAFRCNGNLQQECTYGYWRTLVECEYDCDPVTQKCLGATECKTGTYECIAGNSSYCNNNFWEIKEVCQYGCSEGKCLPEDCNTTRIYTCGDSKESGFSYASYYCEYGSWHYDKTCQGDCDKSTGKCKAVCSSDEYKCEGNDSMRCKDGFWTNYITSCTYGCDSSTGQCKPMCNAGEYRCNDSYSQVCKGGYSWDNDKSCDFGCNSSTGKCECKTIDSMTWSNKSDSTMDWEGAVSYCDNLTECGYSDWHLPTIDELRTTIQNCYDTMPGDICHVSEKNNCLSSSCKEVGNSFCTCTSVDYNETYSIFGDKYINFWSSSVQSDNTDYAWYVGFTYGNVASYHKNAKIYVRCVR